MIAGVGHGKHRHVILAQFPLRLTSESRETIIRCNKTSSRSYQSQKFFATQCRLQEKEQALKSKPERNPLSSIQSQQSDPQVHHAAEEDLPSHREAQRWAISKRTHALMDDLMQRISLAVQRINKYTGTDYTGIEALRCEIKDQGTRFRIRLIH
jgi:sensitive to high expression protein 9, mitochondrial